MRALRSAAAGPGLPGHETRSYLGQRPRSGENLESSAKLSSARTPQVIPWRFYQKPAEAKGTQPKNPEIQSS